jgi:cysteine desulfurase
MSPIYLDYHATTPVDPRVADRVLHFMTTAFGNASSIDHIYGDEAAAAVKQARRQVADLINASPRDIIFTSGATESINLTIQGVVGNSALALTTNLPRIAVSPLEHQAVLDTCDALTKRGCAEMILLQVDSQGRLDLENIENVCATGISLLCVMAANNEIGNLYPVRDIAQIARNYSIPFLCDASQAVGKVPLNFAEWEITYLALSAHKLYGPKGVGALVARQDSPLEPLIFGGGHQNGRRSGTLNVPGIAGLGEACRLRMLEMEDDEKAIARLRDDLQTLLQTQIPDLIINGDRENRLAGNLHISIPGIPNSAIIARIRDRLAISTGSACSSGIEAPSHVLRSLQLSSEAIEGALRIGLGKFTTQAECDRAAEILTTAVRQIRKLMDIFLN